jgi:hypothetical protein
MRPYQKISRPTSFQCLNVEEVSLTEERDIISRICVDDILFVLTEEELTYSPVTLVGMSRIRLIRFQSDGVPLASWVSFPSLSIRQVIFDCLSEVTANFSKALNSTSMGQRMKYSFSVNCPGVVFMWLKTKLQSVAGWRARKGRRTMKKMYHDLS